jgi:hypothetical protein
MATFCLLHLMTASLCRLRIGLDDRGLVPGKEMLIFICRTTFRASLGPGQPHVLCVLGRFPPGKFAGTLSGPLSNKNAGLDSWGDAQYAQ